MPKKRRRLALLSAPVLSLNKAGDEAIAEHYSDYARTEVPGGTTATDTGKNDAFVKSRLLARTHYWLKPYFALKASIVNYGLRLGPAKVKKKKPGQREIDRLGDWLEEEMDPVKFEGNATIGVPKQAIVKRRERVEKFILEVVSEWILQRNVLAFWSDGIEVPVVLPPERCRYKDVLGVETLFYTHGLGAAEIKELDPK